jgi:hypothetical protein
MHEILICSANEDLLTALLAASGAEGVRLTLCRRGMDAVRALIALSFDRLILDLETPARRPLHGLHCETNRPAPSGRRGLPGPVVQARDPAEGSRTIWCPLTVSPEIAQMIALGVESVPAGFQQIG